MYSGETTMKHTVIMLIVLATGFSAVQAESLWKKRTADHAFLFVDSKARRIGDLLTIVVSQDTDVNSQEDRGMGKSSEAKEAFSLESEAGGGFGTQASNAALDIGNKSSRKFSGNSSFSQQSGVY